MTIRIDGTNTTANPGMTGGDADTGLVFGTDEVKIVTGGTDRVTVGSTGNLSIAAGNLVLASGSGIDFSATADGLGATNINELLDDYEYGTFTPEYAGETSPGSFTYGTNEGYYTKIGRQVTVEIALTNITEVSGGSGLLNVTGLPFVDTGSYSCGSVRFDNFNFAVGTNYVVPVRGGGTKLQFQEVKSGAQDSAMGVNDRVGDLSDMFISYTYTVG